VLKRCVRILLIKHPSTLTRRDKFLRKSEPRIGVVTRARQKLHWKLREPSLRGSILSPKQGTESPPAVNSREPAGLQDTPE